VKDVKEVAGKSDPAVKPVGKIASKEKVARWFELQTATISTRYRFVENSSGATVSNQMQHNEVFKGRFKFDRAGDYSLNFGAASGNSLTGGWSATGIGTGQKHFDLYLKQLYFSAKPVKGVEMQYGGLSFERGETTEITGYDNDAYLTGERVIVKRPKELFFDEIAVTYAYLGDITKPGVNRRFQRLNESNYHQFLVSKKFGKRAVASLDYTFQSGIETLREAVKVASKETRVFDSVRFEVYQRMDFKPDYGFAVAGDKNLSKRFTVGGGYAQIDRNYGGLNGDRYNKGKRLFANASFNISPEFSVSAFATRSVANDFAVGNRTRVDLIFTYNLLGTLKRTKLF
jgi:hypothetical protein